MTNKSKYLLVLLAIFTLFPSICFSELKTVEGEYCDVYLGDIKNKKELDILRKTVKQGSIVNGIYKLTEGSKFFSEECFRHVISNYVEKVIVISHTEKSRKICDKVKITVEPEVINKYLNQDICKNPFFDLISSWELDIDNVLTKKSDKINIGLIIETKIPDLEENKREQLENEEEKQFFNMTAEEGNKDKYKVVDRRHLSKVLEEQKLSSSGITDSETVKLGKILNLDIIVLRLIYKNNKVTKVLKVDTGEVLLFKTYKTETETKEGWIFYGKSDDGDQHYYDQQSIKNVSPNVVKVWNKMKYSKVRKDHYIQYINDLNKSIEGYDKLDYEMKLFEFNCVNNTSKVMEIVEYNYNNEIINIFDYPDPTIDHIYTCKS